MNEQKSGIFPTVLLGKPRIYVRLRLIHNHETFQVYIFAN